MIGFILMLTTFAVDIKAFSGLVVDASSNSNALPLFRYLVVNADELVTQGMKNNSELNRTIINHSTELNHVFKNKFPFNVKHFDGINNKKVSPQYFPLQLVKAVNERSFLFVSPFKEYELVAFTTERMQSRGCKVDILASNRGIPRTFLEGFELKRHVNQNTILKLPYRSSIVKNYNGELAPVRIYTIYTKPAVAESGVLKPISPHVLKMISNEEVIDGIDSQGVKIMERYENEEYRSDAAELIHFVKSEQLFYVQSNKKIDQ